MFEYMLARELHMTRAQLVHSMSGSEFAHWIAFFQLEQYEQRRQMKQAEGHRRAVSQARGG